MFSNKLWGDNKEFWEKKKVSRFKLGAACMLTARQLKWKKNIWREKAPVFPFCTGCTNCPVFLCSRRPASPVLRDEKTDQTCFSSDSRRPIEPRPQEDVCSVREYSLRVTISNRLSGCRQVSPSAVKLQKTLMESRWQPWFGSIQYSPKRGWIARSLQIVFK